MQHTGLVISCQDDKALVRFVRSKACAHCGACISFGENEAQVELQNILHAQPGDVVEIELKPRAFLKASFLAYIVPLCALLAGIVLGSLISDLAAVLLGLGGAALTYLALKLLEPRFSHMTELRPRMINICDKAGEER